VGRGRRTVEDYDDHAVLGGGEGEVVVHSCYCCVADAVGGRWVLGRYRAWWGGEGVCKL